MQKTTYLIGAGASHGTIPIVNEFQEGLNAFPGMIRGLFNPTLTAEFNKHNTLKFQFDDAIKNLTSTYENLAKIIGDHASVDTYAKKLFITDKLDELTNIKFYITLYFNFIQYYIPTNKRYDAFIASLINEDELKFPKHVNIISWNYDFQFELSYSQYLKKVKTLSHFQSALNVCPPCFDNNDHKTIFKINGSAFFENEKQQLLGLYGDNIRAEHQDLGFETLNQFLLHFHINNSYPTAINFAWARSKKDKHLIDMIMSQTMDTECLVVIGYSFPFFNRGIDRTILNNMKGLSEVYIQDPFAEEVAESFKSINEKIEPHLIKQTKQFYLPRYL